MTTRALLNQHRRDLVELIAMANGDVRTVLATLDTKDAMREALRDVLPQLIALYGAAAVELGAEWYDEARDAVSPRGRFRAVPGDVHDAGSAYSLANWASQEATDTVTLPALIQGGIQKRIADMDRQSITRSATLDPASVGWKRIGAGACKFCRVLIERDELYTEATADFASHTNCNCQAYPQIRGAEPIDVKEYIQSSRYDSITDADRARVREYMRTH